MRTKIYVSIVTLALLITSCNVIDDLLTFNISNQTSFKIQTGFVVGNDYITNTPDVTTNSSSEFENNNTKAELVKDVKLKELKLTIVDPTDKTFSFLKSVHLYISTNTDDEIELAHLTEINSTANTLNLICTTQKLDKYIKASSYKIRTKSVTKETFTKDITINVDMKFQVTADPF